MLFFSLHQMIQNLLPGNFTNQTRNLLTFLIGIVLYTIFFTYLFKKNNESKSLLINSMKGGFTYILLSDCISMGIIYKNYYNRSITSELKEVWSGDKNTSNVETVNTKKSENILNEIKEIQDRIDLEKSKKKLDKIVEEVNEDIEDIDDTENIDIEKNIENFKNLEENINETKTIENFENIDCTSGVCKIKK